MDDSRSNAAGFLKGKVAEPGVPRLRSRHVMKE
jgi:hypothetical protein